MLARAAPCRFFASAAASASEPFVGRNAYKAQLQRQVETALLQPRVAVVFQYFDLRPSEWTDLRCALRDKGAHVKVLHSRVTRRLLNETRYKHMGDMFVSSNCVMYTDSGSLKDVLAVSDRIKKLDLVGGRLESNILTRDQLREYSALPPIDVLRGELLAIMSAPAQQMHRTLGAVGESLVSVLSRIEDKPAAASN